MIPDKLKSFIDMIVHAFLEALVELWQLTIPRRGVLPFHVYDFRISCILELILVCRDSNLSIEDFALLTFLKERCSWDFRPGRTPAGADSLRPGMLPASGSLGGTHDAYLTVW